MNGKQGKKKGNYCEYYNMNLEARGECVLNASTFSIVCIDKFITWDTISSRDSNIRETKHINFKWFGGSEANPGENLPNSAL